MNNLLSQTTNTTTEEITVPTTTNLQAYEIFAEQVRTSDLADFQEIISSMANSEGGRYYWLNLPCGKEFKLEVRRDEHDTDNPLADSDAVKFLANRTKYDIGNTSEYDYKSEIETYLETKLADFDTSSTYVVCPESCDEWEGDDDGEILNPLNWDDVDLLDESCWSDYVQEANAYLKFLYETGKITEKVELDLDEVFAAHSLAYLYDHSGITVSTYPLDCRWDSGVAGTAFITWEAAEKNWGLTRVDRVVVNDQVKVVYAVSDSDLEDFEAHVYIPEGYKKFTLCEMIKGEIELLDDYLTGNIWEFSLAEDGESMDSCGGFIGDEEACMLEGISELRGNLLTYLDNCAQAQRITENLSANEFVCRILEAENFVEAHHMVDRLRSGQITIK